jgi:energy-coupling factor transporter ATP-binding protein EcfA2
VDASAIPLEKKRQFVLGFNEDNFRDSLIRPLFQRKGFIHGAELCGPTEAGKDCFFRIPAPFGLDHLAVVQTKVGNLNMGREPSKNVEQAATQLRTALNAKVNDLKAKQKRKPNFAFLCTSGVISEQAKAHILDTLENANITFLDINDLVPEIDSNFSEFWYGISADRFPYLKSLETKLLTESEFASLTALIKASDYKSPVSDTGFVPLRLTRTYLKPKKLYGKVTQEPEFEEINIGSLLNRQERRFLVTGEAGSGKTTLLKRLAELLCRDGLNGKGVLIPVVIKALNVAVSSAPLAEDILTTTTAFTANGAAAFGIEALEQGAVCILIDGLDELGSLRVLEAFIQKLSAFDRLYPLGKVILAGRNYSYITQEPAFAGYIRFSVAPIGFKEANQIVKNMGKAKLLQTERSKEIMRQLESIHGFELNPLVVTVFAASSDSTRKDIPSNITELFAKFTELMLGRWDTEKGLSQQYEAKLKALLLQKVAYRMHSEKLVRLPAAEFRLTIERELEELGQKEAKIDTLLDEILNRSSLLREIEGYTEFRHLLIQEFFAGQAITEDVIATYAKDEWWRRAVVFYFGSNPENEAGLRALCRDDISYSSTELFNVGVTLGLSAQACYFVKLHAKAELIHWCIRSLASSTTPLLDETASIQLPIHAFLYTYLVGRDAVGADCTELLAKENPNLALTGGLAAELEEFWLIVGLMESGHLDEAFERIKHFRPSEPLSLLSLHMGAFLIEKVRGSTREQKRLAKHIGDHLQPSIRPLISKYLKEFKSRLIEIQKGEVKELPFEVEQPALL